MTISSIQNQNSIKSNNTLKRSIGHVQPRTPLISIHESGRLRCAHVLALCGFAHSTLYSRIKKGIFPRPDGNDGMNFWNTETVRDYLGLGE
jgi:hypothetical protein